MTNKLHKARKRFGQNFLMDGNIIHAIIEAIHPTPEQPIVEIGPGLGSLTQLLLQAAQEIDVIELDRDVIPKLKVLCEGLGELRIHQQDVLKFDFRSLYKNQQKLRVVGNLPYNISSPLIFHLLDQIDIIEDMHFMLQKEMVDRLTAKVGSHEYNRLSVILQYHCQAEKILDVPPEAFDPAPKVDSAVICLTPIRNQTIEANDIATFSELVKQAFSHRRKTLRNNLKGLVDDAQFESLEINPSLRPQDLSVADFVRISNSLSA